MPEQGKRIVHRFWEEIFNQGKLDALYEVVAPAFRLDDPAQRMSLTREDLRDRIERIRADIPEMRAEVEDVFSGEDDRVAARLTFRAPLRRDETKGSAEWGEFAGIWLSRVSDGQIQDGWLLWESLRAEQELPPGAADWRWPPWR